jgi:hypothetical protein
MKLQSQVCTLEQAKRLKELGISQESYLYHYFFDNVPRNVSGVWRLHHEYYGRFEHYSAFNVAELGVMLPNELDLSNGNYFFTKKGLLHTYEEVTGVILKEWQGTELEAIRRAEILIDLLENNLTTPEEVNTRLIQS